MLICYLWWANRPWSLNVFWQMSHLVRWRPWYLLEGPIYGLVTTGETVRWDWSCWFSTSSLFSSLTNMLSKSNPWTDSANLSGNFLHRFSDNGNSTGNGFFLGLANLGFGMALGMQGYLSLNKHRLSANKFGICITMLSTWLSFSASSACPSFNFTKKFRRILKSFLQSQHTTLGNGLSALIWKKIYFKPTALVKKESYLKW